MIPVDDTATLDAWRAGQLGVMVETVLGDLVGLPFQDMGRAADMAWLGFGPVVKVTSGRPGDGPRHMALHRLHLQCPFRLAGPSGSIACAHDMYAAADVPHKTPSDFDDDRQGDGNLYDRAIARLWMEKPAGSLIVESLSADRWGGFVIAMSDGYSLSVFPASSFAREHWRYFQAGGDSDHFVVLPDPDLD